MNLEKKRNHRGTISVETSIILISAVFVAAALLAVVFNSGFATIQKTKGHISAGVIESRSSLIASGAIVGIASVSEDKLNVTAIPIKSAVAGAEPINLRVGDAIVKLITEDRSYENVYTSSIVDVEYSNLQDAMQRAVSDGTLLKNPINQTAATEETQAILFFTINRNNNDKMDSGEHAFIIIVFKDSERLSSLDFMSIEVVLTVGTTLTLERMVPNLTSRVVNFS